MRRTTVSCDRCEAVAGEDQTYWTLAFSRELVSEDVTEYLSEVWDLCDACYAAVSPTVAAAVQPEDEEE